MATRLAAELSAPQGAVHSLIDRGRSERLAEQIAARTVNKERARAASRRARGGGVPIFEQRGSNPTHERGLATRRPGA